jgi:cell division protein FtsI/penicillin-binding protein 2
VSKVTQVVALLESLDIVMLDADIEFQDGPTDTLVFDSLSNYLAVEDFRPEPLMNESPIDLPEYQTRSTPTDDWVREVRCRGPPNKS